MKLADDSRGSLRGLSRMQELVLRALERRRGFQRCVERLDDALRVGERTLRYPGDAGALLRQIAAGRKVDARDLEQRDA